MKHSLFSMTAGVAAIILAVVGAVLVLETPFQSAGAAGAFRCDNSSLYFPADGTVGWRYSDPASTDRDAQGNPTVHTGVDIFADGGSGATVYAPASGMVSRQHSATSQNLILSGVTNVVTGETGIEVYVTHFTPSLSIGDRFKAGDAIGVQTGDHVHFSVGSFMGFDDREIDQTQDPSPYFGADLAYDPAATDRHEVAHWCDPSIAANVEVVALQTATPTPTVSPAPTVTPSSAAAATQEPQEQEYFVQPGDTLSVIASSFNTTVDAIAEASGLIDLDVLEVGQRLVIPGAAGATAPAAATQPATDQPPASPQSYIVVAGDTLYSIAAQFGITVDEIANANAMTEMDYLSIGQELLIPGAGAGGSVDVAEDTTASETTAAAGSGGEYTVVEGDTLSSIAAANGTDVETLQSLNAIDDPSFINLGDTLLLP